MQVGVCWSAGVGKEKFDLMTGGGDKNQSLEARGLCTLALKNFRKEILSGTKVRSLLEHSCAILISFKIVVIFNTTSADIKTKSADVILKITTILKEIRIAQL